MTDSVGLLDFPAPAVDDGEAVTDPALDLLLDFCQAVLNADLSAAWAAVSPSDPKPVRFVFNHNPDLESFNDSETPALYMWRSDDTAGATQRLTQDIVVDSGGFQALWVPPAMDQESKRAREGIRNGIKKSLKRALANGRHPAWVLDGDTYYDPEYYGSSLAYHTKLSQIRLGQFRAHDLDIDSEDRSGKWTYPCLFFTIDAIEYSVGNPSAYDNAPLNDLRGISRLPAQGDLTDQLDFVMPGRTLTYRFDVQASGLDPATGGIAGGTDVTITGAQFVDGMVVRFGTTDASAVEFVDESTIVATTPAHTAGAVDVVVVHPSGDTATLANAFTFV